MYQETSFLPAQAAPAFASFENLQHLGKLKTLKSKEIVSSRFGVGFETLDRQMWDPEQAWPVLNDLGVKWARVQTGWARCEKQKGAYDFTWLDEIVEKLLERGVMPWLSFSYGNSLYTSESDPTGVGYPPIETDVECAAWSQYVEALVLHFRDRVDHFEVWNEPDLTSFWKRGPRAADYVQLVRLTAEPLRRLHPNAKLIGGAIAWGMTAWSIKYLEDCFLAGMHELVDIISYHGYKSVPERHSTQELPAFRHLIDKYKPSLEYWQGEAGVQSKVPETGNAGALSTMRLSETIQARMLLRRTLLELSHGCGMSSYFHMADFAHYAADRRTYHYGLVRLEDGSPKPAFYALQSLTTLLSGDLETAEGRTSCHMSVLSDTHDPRATKASTWHANFVSGDVPVHCWWLPDSVEEDTVWQHVEMNFWMDAALKLEQPVLIDPVNQDVYAVVFDWDRRACAETWMDPDPEAAGIRVFKPLPIGNSPLILTDRSKVQVVENNKA